MELETYQEAGVGTTGMGSGALFGSGSKGGGVRSRVLPGGRHQDWGVEA